MKQKITLALCAGFIAFTAMFFLAPGLATVSAQTPIITGGGGTNCGNTCVDNGLGDIKGAFPNSNTTNVQDFAKKIINWALYLSAIIAVIFIIIGGFIYITSAGDATKATKGRTTLVNALIGLTIIVLSYLIVQVVYNFLVN